MNSDKEFFLQSMKELDNYQHALTVLNYDGETAMPAAGANSLARVIGYLSGRRYELLTKPEFLDIARGMQGAVDQPLWLRREAEELAREGERLAVIPAQEYEDFCALVSEAGSVWREAKLGNDYDKFAPWLEKLIKGKKRQAEYFAPDKPVYDTLLDEYDRGLTADMLDPFFELLKEKLIPLIAETGRKPAPDTRCLEGRFPVDKQKQLSHWLMELMGIDAKRCTLSESEHPFTTNTSNCDVRITTHYYEDDLAGNLYSVIHEGGHALYMLNTADELNGTTLCQGAGMSLHESQSRLCENMLGRSRAFISLLDAKLAELFPEQFGQVSVDTLYAALNQCRPGPIRILADELTYPLHILIRYELEKQMFSEDIEIKELPERWNKLYADYLGVKVRDAGSGILQDTHWSGASFGYFPTYALGSAYAAQIMAAIRRELDVDGLLAAGELQPVMDWLTARIWRWGGLKTPPQLLTEATGQGFAPHFYTDYLEQKFRELYNI